MGSGPAIPFCIVHGTKVASKGFPWGAGLRNSTIKAWWQGPHHAYPAARGIPSRSQSCQISVRAVRAIQVDKERAVEEYHSQWDTGFERAVEEHHSQWDTGFKLRGGLYLGHIDGVAL